MSKESPTIALAVMTRNGLNKLPRLLKSTADLVDCVVALDTGSADGTAKFLRDYGAEVHEAPFVDFATSRNQLTELAKNAADWLLLLDDDMSLRLGRPAAEIKASLDMLNPAYLLKHTSGIEYWVTRLIQPRFRWNYVGVTHEYITSHAVQGTHPPRLEGIEIDHFFNHGPQKFIRDLKLLTADIARDPNDTRTIFYIAQTLKDSGHTLAAIRFYVMRAEMGGWDEEVYYAMYQAARLAEDPIAMQKAHYFRISRAEAAAWLAHYYFQLNELKQATMWETIRSQVPTPTPDILFVQPQDYGPR